MLYLLIFLSIAIIVYYCNDYIKRLDLKRNGIKTIGAIIYNKEISPRSMYRLGGNINSPTIRFITINGEEIIGQPILGFVSQHEVMVPSQVFIIYDRKEPGRFMIAS